MTVELLPNYTRPARQRWESIPADIRQRLLANVWCMHCRHEVTIANFSGTIKSGNLLLTGKCAECHGDVARVIEGT
jgi:Zn finger protein HypA/HybF involved in hydrogenase expression